jgi:glycosyltransferase involved in cell wall biosynthesis
MKILGVEQNKSGSNYYRLEMPFQHLTQTTDIEYARCSTINGMPNEVLQQFDAVILSREFEHHNDVKNIKLIADQLRTLGVKIIVDIDDYWNLSAFHVLKQQYRLFKAPEKIIESIKYADLVTTTNVQLAEKISKLNHNAEVLPNAIYPEIYPQFQPNYVPGDKYRIGYMGGVCHWEDVVLMQDGFKQLHADRELQGRFTIKLFGYNDESPEYGRFEQVFTDRGRGKDYERVYATDVYNYALGYNHLEACIVPLNDNTFNNCKSELKMIEAGFMGKACIVSDIKPYTDVIKNGVNCIAIDKNRNHKDWYKAMRKLINEPDYGRYLADNLSKEVKERYHIAIVNKKRYKLLKSL